MTPHALGTPIGLVMAAEAPIIGGRPRVVGIRVMLVATHGSGQSPRPMVRLGWS